MIIKIAPWVSCRSWIVSDAEGMSIISNQKTHKIILLNGESSNIWSRLERGQYSDKSAIRYLEQAGSEDPVSDLEAFWASLTEEQCVVNESSPRYLLPDPPPAPMKGITEANITPVASQDDKALEDEATMFAERHGFLFSAFWEVTNRCNEKCIHCFNPGAPHATQEKSNRKTDEMTTEQARQMIKSLHDAGAYRFVISGGEVFLRKDIFDLIAYARSFHMQVHIFTNGLLLDENRLEKLANAYPETVSISIYSANAVIHDSVTRVPGSFETSLNALRRLNELGIKTTIKAIQMAHTVQGYDEIAELGRSVGARTTIELNMSAGNDGALGPLSLAVSDESTLVALAVTPGSPIFVGSAENNYSERRRDPAGTFCSAGQSLISVSSDGKVYPCVALPLEVGDLANEDVRDIWTSSTVASRQPDQAGKSKTQKNSTLSQWQNIKVSDYVECGTHDRCGWCNKCPGMSLNETGNALSASAVQCNIAAARMKGANLLREGHSREDIFAMLGVPLNFGSDSSDRPIPSIPVAFSAREGDGMSKTTRDR